MQRPTILDRGSAPWFTSPGPGPRQPFADQLIAKRAAAARYDPQFTTVLILISASDGPQFKGSAIEQFDKAMRRAHAELVFIIATRLADLWCIDVSNADLYAIKPEGISNCGELACWNKV